MTVSQRPQKCRLSSPRASGDEEVSTRARNKFGRRMELSRGRDALRPDCQGMRWRTCQSVARSLVAVTSLMLLMFPRWRRRTASTAIARYLVQLATSS